MKYPRTAVAVLLAAYLFAASGCKCGKKAVAEADAIKMPWAENVEQTVDNIKEPVDPEEKVDEWVPTQNFRESK